MTSGKGLAAFALALPPAGRRRRVAAWWWAHPVSEAPCWESRRSANPRRPAQGSPGCARGDRHFTSARRPVRIQLEIDRAQRTLPRPRRFDPAKPLVEHEVADVAVTLEMTSTVRRRDRAPGGEGAARRPTTRTTALDPAARPRCVRRALDAALRDAVRRSAPSSTPAQERTGAAQGLTRPIRGCATTPSACWRSAQPGCRSAADRPPAGSRPGISRRRGALIAIGDRRRSRRSST